MKGTFIVILLETKHTKSPNVLHIEYLLSLELYLHHLEEVVE